MNDNKQFTWIPFYMELAQVLLTYKDRRKELIDWIYKDLSQIKGVGGKSLIDYLHEKDGSHISDIDPFSIFAIFNRATSSRSLFLEAFKTKFHLSESVPTDFDGIPVVDARRSFFFSWEADNKERIETIWTMFEKVLHNEDFAKEFDYLISQSGISYGITMCLFWILPYTYLSLDSRNREYLNMIGIRITSMPNYNSYTDLIKQIKQKMDHNSIPYKSFPELSFKVWQKDNSTDMDMNKLQYYIDLLKANHNIIFNGAPGTGKTYLAKKIAEEMGAKYKMAQFHPSYDYTDFVEGLRPIKDEKGNIGFERKDGVFKEFCKEAFNNKRGSKQRSLIGHIDEYIKVLRDCALKHYPSYYNDVIKPLLRKQNAILEIQNNNLVYIENTVQLKNNKATVQKISSILFPRKDVLMRFILNCQRDSDDPKYARVVNILKEINNYLSKLDMNIDRKQPFVFIIDEINRGEISKIFGELFFSIDPGYRGKKGKVQTQYQNLVEEGDVFKDGFYVPENVYIIGTMNDIDRSVESMDFAMRRRFAWQEITADESAENMGITGELRERMDSLNKVIEKTEGLGSAYQVGAAMFLKVKDTEENVEGNCGMTVESLWNLNLKSLMKEYLRGLPNEKDILQEMEDAYFLRNKETSDNTQLTIRSRFSEENEEDYFLHYMLQKVLSLNIIELKHKTADEQILDFLIYLFPSLLKRAIRQGIFKEYQNRAYDNANIKGRINVSKFIQKDIPFAGHIAYNTREYCALRETKVNAIPIFIKMQ